MHTTTKILITLLLLFSFSSSVARADAALHTKTIFYFQKDGQPFNQPVKFTVRCYGTSAIDKKGKLYKISELSEDCETYGCGYSYNLLGYRANIEYCDLEGEANGDEFTIDKFIGQSLAGLNCRNANEGIWDIARDDKYYKETPKYKGCMDAIRKEYYPDDKNFICHQYLVEVPKDECGGYGWITIDDKCYKFTDKTKACIAQKDQKEKLCNQYLKDVTSKIEKSEQGLTFDQICEAKINIPTDIGKNQQQKTEVTPAVDSSLDKSFFVRVIDFIKCFFLKLFGGTC